uniref:Uncharacterized protein n=1 Tax=Arundo donax TaxID=35708 RepID=A0A0A9CSA1_ARUDO
MFHPKKNRGPQGAQEPPVQGYSTPKRFESWSRTRPRIAHLRTPVAGCLKQPFLLRLRLLPFLSTGDLKDEHHKVGRTEIGQKSRCLFT